MATPSEKLAESLEALKELQDKGIMAIKASELSRVHRERLSKNGFLSEVMKGWYLSDKYLSQKCQYDAYQEVLSPC